MKRGERGQTLLEAVAALGVSCLVGGAFALALGGAARVPRHDAEARAAGEILDDLATDLRAATAYDPGAVAAVAAAGSRAYDVTVAQPRGTPLVAHVATMPASGALRVSVTVGTQHAGAALPIATDAPAPGATVLVPAVAP